MARQQAAAAEPAAEPKKAAIKPRRFEIPDDLPDNFNVSVHQETFVQGFVDTADVRVLLDAFGLHERKQVVFPFQHIGRKHGETWAMRIEPLSAQSLDGVPVMAHTWIFHRQQPEVTGSDS